MKEVQNHFCPGCGTPLEAFLRYPWHFCRSCCTEAVDGAGRRLEFGNEGLSGGFMFRYAGDGDEGWIPCRAVLALIADRPVRITEARFGGIVAEPIPDRPQPRDAKDHDLRGRDRVPISEPEPQGVGRGRPFSDE